MYARPQGLDVYSTAAYGREAESGTRNSSAVTVDGRSSVKDTGLHRDCIPKTRLEGARKEMG